MSVIVRIGDQEYEYPDGTPDEVAWRDARRRAGQGKIGGNALDDLINSFATGAVRLGPETAGGILGLIPGLGDPSNQLFAAANKYAEPFEQRISPELLQEQINQEITPGTVGASLAESAPSTMTIMLPSLLATRNPRLASAIAGGGEGIVSAGQTMNAIEQEIRNYAYSNLEEFLQSPTGNQAMWEANGDVDKAIQIVADRASPAASAISGVITGAIGAGGAPGAPMAGPRGFLSSILRRAIQEGPLEELPQSINEQIAHNIAVGTVDPKKGLFQDVPHAATMGTIAGGIAGAGFGAAERLGGGQEPTEEEIGLAETIDRLRRGEQAVYDASGQQIIAPSGDVTVAPQGPPRRPTPQQPQPTEPGPLEEEEGADQPEDINVLVGELQNEGYTYDQLKRAFDEGRITTLREDEEPGQEAGTAEDEEEDEEEEEVTGEPDTDFEPVEPEEYEDYFKSNPVELSQTEQETIQSAVDEVRATGIPNIIELAQILEQNGLERVAGDVVEEAQKYNNPEAGFAVAQAYARYSTRRQEGVEGQEEEETPEEVQEAEVLEPSEQAAQPEDAAVSEPIEPATEPEPSPIAPQDVSSERLVDQEVREAIEELHRDGTDQDYRDFADKVSLEVLRKLRRDLQSRTPTDPLISSYNELIDIKRRPNRPTAEQLEQRAAERAAGPEITPPRAVTKTGRKIEAEKRQEIPEEDRNILAEIARLIPYAQVEHQQTIRGQKPDTNALVTLKRLINIYGQRTRNEPILTKKASSSDIIRAARNIQPIETAALTPEDAVTAGRERAFGPLRGEERRIAAEDITAVSEEDFMKEWQDSTPEELINAIVDSMPFPEGASEETQQDLEAAKRNEILDNSPAELLAELFRSYKKLEREQTRGTKFESRTKVESAPETEEKRTKHGETAAAIFNKIKEPGTRVEGLDELAKSPAPVAKLVARMAGAKKSERTKRTDSEAFIRSAYPIDEEEAAPETKLKKIKERKARKAAKEAAAAKETTEEPVKEPVKKAAKAKLKESEEFPRIRKIADDMRDLAKEQGIPVKDISITFKDWLPKNIHRPLSVMPNSLIRDLADTNNGYDQIEELWNEFKKSLQASTEQATEEAVTEATEEAVTEEPVETTSGPEAIHIKEANALRSMLEEGDIKGYLEAVNQIVEENDSPYVRGVAEALTGQKYGIVKNAVAAMKEYAKKKVAKPASLAEAAAEIEKEQATKDIQKVAKIVLTDEQRKAPIKTVNEAIASLIDNIDEGVTFDKIVDELPFGRKKAYLDIFSGLWPDMDVRNIAKKTIADIKAKMKTTRDELNNPSPTDSTMSETIKSNYAFAMDSTESEMRKAGTFKDYMERMSSVPQEDLTEGDKREAKDNFRAEMSHVRNLSADLTMAAQGKVELDTEQTQSMLDKAVFRSATYLRRLSQDERADALKEYETYYKPGTKGREIDDFALNSLYDALSANIDGGPMLMRSANNIPTPTLTEQAIEEAQALAGALRKHLNQAGLKDIGIRIANHVVSWQGMFEHARVIDADAAYFAKTITLAYSSLDADMTLDEKIETAKAKINHEMIHAMNQLGLFTENEQDILAKYAKESGKIDELRNTPSYKGISESVLVEEAIAELYREWNGVAPSRTLPAGVRRVFYKLGRFVEGIIRALQSRNFHIADNLFQNAEDIFNAIQEGHIGRMQRNLVRGAETPSGRSAVVAQQMFAPGIKVKMAKDTSFISKVRSLQTKLPDISHLEGARFEAAVVSNLMAVQQEWKKVVGKAYNMDRKWFKNSYGDWFNPIHAFNELIVKQKDEVRKGTESVSGEDIYYLTNLMLGEINDAIEGNGVQQMYLFAGPGSFEANMSNFATARVMERSNMPMDEIFAMTGWFRGFDNMWRYEIDDSLAELDEEVFTNMSNTYPIGKRGTHGIGLSEIFKHDALYRAYPWLKSKEVAIVSEAFLPPGTAAVSNDRKRIYMPRKTKPGSKYSLKQILIHEIQHLIQERETFASGGNWKAFMPKDVLTRYRNFVDELRVMTVKAMEGQKVGIENINRLRAETSEIVNDYNDARRAAHLRYWHLYGEIEARKVSDRSDMSIAERKVTYPYGEDELQFAEVMFKYTGPIEMADPNYPAMPDNTRVDFYFRHGDENFRVTLKHKREVIGNIRGRLQPRNRVARIDGSGIDEAYRNRRLGLKMYQALAKKITEMNQALPPKARRILVSDSSVSPEAVRVYKSKEMNEQFNILQNEHVYRGSDGGLIATAFGPVFAILPKASEGTATWKMVMDRYTPKGDIDDAIGPMLMRKPAAVLPNIPSKPRYIEETPLGPIYVNPSMADLEKLHLSILEEYQKKGYNRSLAGLYDIRFITDKQGNIYVGSGLTFYHETIARAMKLHKANRMRWDILDGGYIQRDRYGIWKTESGYNEQDFLNQKILNTVTGQGPKPMMMATSKQVRRMLRHQRMQTKLRRQRAKVAGTPSPTPAHVPGSRVLGTVSSQTIRQILKQTPTMNPTQLTKTSKWTRWYFPLNDLPYQNLYLVSRGRTGGNIHEFEEFAKQFVDFMHTATKKERDEFNYYMTHRNAPILGISNVKMRGPAQAAKDLFYRMGKKFQQTGILDKAQFSKYQNMYLPRMFLEYVQKELTQQGLKTSAQTYTKERLGADAGTAVWNATNVVDEAFNIETLRRDVQPLWDTATGQERIDFGKYLRTGKNLSAITHPGLHGIAQRVRDELNRVKAKVDASGFITPKMKSGSLVARYGDNYMQNQFLVSLRNKASMGRVFEQDATLGLITDPFFLTYAGIIRQGRDLSVIRFLEEIAHMATSSGIRDMGWVVPHQFVTYKGRQMTFAALGNELRKLQFAKDRLDHPLLQQFNKEMTDEIEAIFKAANIKVGVGTPFENLVEFDKANYRQLPTTNSYGDLAGLIVHKAIYDDIVGMAGAASVNMPGIEKEVDKVTGRAMRGFKRAVTTLNPPTHFRQMFQNLFTLYLGGVGSSYTLGGDTARWIGMALWDSKKDSDIWKLFQELGGIQGTFTEAEIRRSLDALSELKIRELKKKTGNLAGLERVFAEMGRVAKKVGGKAADYYNFYDTMARYTMFYFQIKKNNMAPGDAIVESFEWIPDYTLVPTAVRMARNTVHPFITWQYKLYPKMIDLALRGMAKIRDGAVQFNPQQMASGVSDIARLSVPIMLYSGIIWGVIAAIMGLDDDEAEALRESMSKELKRNIGVLPLPTRDSHGNFVLVDMGLYFPWTPIAQAFRNLGMKQDPFQFAFDLGIGGPFIDFSISLAGKDRFTGYDLWEQDATGPQKMAAWFSYAMNYYMPPMFRGMTDPLFQQLDLMAGGYRRPQLGASGFMGRFLDKTFGDGVTTSGKYVEDYTALGARAFGFNTWALDPVDQFERNRRRMENEISEQRRQLGYLKAEVNRQIASINADTTKSEEEKQREIESINNHFTHMQETFERRQMEIRRRIELHDLETAAIRERILTEKGDAFREDITPPAEPQPMESR